MVVEITIHMAAVLQQWCFGVFVFSLAIFSCENQDSGPEFPQVLSCVLDALQVGLQRATELIDELIKRPDVTCKQVAVTHVSRLSGTKNICKCCTAGGGGLTIITIHISSGLIKPQFTTRPPPNVIDPGLTLHKMVHFHHPAQGWRIRRVLRCASPTVLPTVRQKP